MLLEDNRDIGRPQLFHLCEARTLYHPRECRAIQTSGRLLVPGGRHAAEQSGRHPPHGVGSNRSSQDRRELPCDPQDLKDLIAGLRMAREIGNSAALRPFTGREITPGFLNAAELARFFRDGLGTFWHQCCAAKMGCDAMSVVDGKLKVYGVDGLRIADASIMPLVTTGSTMAPCVVIGEQAAALLQREITY
jgi:choline dehydrogenase-like flavoprotein